MNLLACRANVVDDYGQIPAPQVVLGVQDISESQVFNRCRVSDDIFHLREVELLKDAPVFVVYSRVIK